MGARPVKSKALMVVACFLMLYSVGFQWWVFKEVYTKGEVTIWHYAHSPFKSFPMEFEFATATMCLVVGVILFVWAVKRFAE